MVALHAIQIIYKIQTKETIEKDFPDDSSENLERTADLLGEAAARGYELVNGRVIASIVWQGHQRKFTTSYL